MVTMSGQRTPYQEAARELLRQTLFGAARDQLQERPWSEVTMADIASAAGVSRQTLYNEFGNRNEFGLAFVIDVGEGFLDAVEAAVREHLDDPDAAIGAALELFLRSAGEDPLIKMLLSDDGSGGMLPFVTTQGLPVARLGDGAARRRDRGGLAAGGESRRRPALRIAGAAGDQPHHRARRVAGEDRGGGRRAARALRRAGAGRRLSRRLRPGAARPARRTACRR